MRTLPWWEIAGSSILFLLGVVFVLLITQGLVRTKDRAISFERTETRAGNTVYTTLAVPDVGHVAVRVRIPQELRFGSDAPVVVYVPEFLTPDQKAFSELPGMTDYGIAQVSFLLPGRRDRETDMYSEGTFDAGGAVSRAALHKVMLFASGQSTDIAGKTLWDLTEGAVSGKTFGAYAFSHAGILLFTTIAEGGSDIPLDFVVAHEIPTEPSLTSLELGHFLQGKTIYHPFYDPARDYTDTKLALSYALIAWDAQAERPYLDLNADGRARADDDMLMSTFVPGMFDKAVYSPELLTALRQNELFTSATWPAHLATPEEATAWWAERSVVNALPQISAQLPRLPVMIVFGARDHQQPADDKPHIHQLFSGLVAQGLWTRLNPDAAYVSEIEPLFKEFIDYPANTEPQSWVRAVEWGHVGGAGALRIMPFAALAEMSDRVHFQVWDADLTHVLRTGE